MIKNGILIKVTSLEGTFTSNDATILGGKNSLLSDDKRDLFVALKSTYGKYNNGSLSGAWLDLSDYSDKEEFYEACRELHKDEEDAEYMFQDWENVPEGLIGES